jgi:hypothetical protein
MSIILPLAACRSESGPLARQARPARISGKDAVRIFGTGNEKLVALSGHADSNRPELTEARTFIAAK